MKPLGALSVAGFRHAYRSRAAVAVFLVLCAMLMALLVYFGMRYMIAPAGEASRAHFFGLLLYGSSLFMLGLNFNSFTTRPLVREKTQRILESVLACPVSVREVWLAKVLAVFLPGTIMSTVVTLGIGLTVAIVRPELGIRSLANPWVLMAGFVWVPLVYLALGLLSQGIGLGGSAVTANVIPQIFLPVCGSVVINLGARSIITTDSWLFALVNAGMVLAFGAGALIAGRRLTAERITLSSRSGP